MDFNNRKLKVCMIVQDPSVKGGIAAVTGGYYGSRLEEDIDITYVESYCDGSKFKKLIKALKAYRTFRKVLKNNPPDIVHVHSSFGPSFFRKYPIIHMAYKKKIPVVNHIHGSALKEHYLDAPNWKKRMVEKSYGECARLIVLSKEWQEKLSVIVPIEKICVVPNYSKIFKETVSEESINNRFRKKQILYLGRFDALKGVSDIPAIASKVRESGLSANFVVGGDGEKEPVLSNIDKLNVADIVSLPGWITGEKKDALLRESAIFLLPSHMEAMPMSILEAMGYGLPIVSCDVGGIPQVVQKDINGKLYSPGDTDKMAEGIISYLSDLNLYREASKKSLEIADNNYSFEAHINKLEDIYRQVLN